MQTRTQAALETREHAARIAQERPHPEHRTNGDELRFRHVADDGPIGRKAGEPSFLMSFTKGMPHDPATGLLETPDHFRRFVLGIDTGEPRDFADTPLGPASPADRWRSRSSNGAGLRGWESAGAGATFDLEGPDAQAVTMPPPPRLGSDELTAEMGELYAQALLRDVPFAAMAHLPEIAVNDNQRERVEEVVGYLGHLKWFADPDDQLDPASAGRRRATPSPETAFRGITPGDLVGPYISQFLVAGTAGLSGADGDRKPEEGYIRHGAMSCDQRVRQATSGDDHMTVWNEWLDVQNAAKVDGRESYEPAGARRFITTPRDLATYVHFDALYQAYLDACLVLLTLKVPFDPGIPFQRPDEEDHQQGFAHFGGPHILSLVTEVATRALKAVRFQKFNVHRRLRPEALAARMEMVDALEPIAPELRGMFDELADCELLLEIKSHNQQVGGAKNGTFLLPMAFSEGSPMHPSYGAGHATVAGACVTILKAFFDHGWPLDVTGKGGHKAFVPDCEGGSLHLVDVRDAKGEPAHLTVEGELDKLAANISIGRDWAGVHYFSDYVESLRLGERIAIGILQEQRLTYRETMSMTVPLFDGGTIRI